MCSIVFHAFTLKLPIQTLPSVVPTRSVFWRATQFEQNEHTPANQISIHRHSTLLNKFLARNNSLNRNNIISCVVGLDFVKVSRETSSGLKEAKDQWNFHTSLTVLHTNVHRGEINALISLSRPLRDIRFNLKLLYLCHHGIYNKRMHLLLKRNHSTIDM